MAITISTLSQDSTLDRQAMRAVRGGTNTWMQGLGAVASINVGVNQNINQFQRVDVNTLNHVGVIGPGFGPLRLEVAPQQFGNATALF